MSELEKEALKYAQSTCTQSENISLDNLLDYAKTDFIAGAEWHKSISKEPEMLEMLQRCLNTLESFNPNSGIASNVRTLIKEAKTL